LFSPSRKSHIFTVGPVPFFVVLQSQSPATSFLTRVEEIFVLPRKWIFIICSLQMVAALIAIILQVKVTCYAFCYCFWLLSSNISFKLYQIKYKLSPLVKNVQIKVQIAIIVITLKKKAALEFGFSSFIDYLNIIIQIFYNHQKSKNILIKHFMTRQ
jgi:hypothetical protein